MRKPLLVTSLLVLILTAHGTARAAPSLSHRLKWMQLKLTAELGEHLAPIVGLTELLGVRYPIKPYRAMVSSGRLMRGSRLEPGDAARLKAQGVDTIVSFCAERDRFEEQEARANGLRFVRIPVIDNTVPRPSQLQQFVGIMRDTSNGLVYGHCQAGKGRTGVFVAAYRMAVDGWPIGKAMAEAHRHGLKLRSQRQAIIDFGRALRVELPAD